MKIKNILSLFLLAFSTLTFGITFSVKDKTATYELSDVAASGDRNVRCESNLRKSKLEDVEYCYRATKLQNANLYGKNYSVYRSSNATILVFSLDVYDNGLRVVDIFTESEWQAFLKEDAQVKGDTAQKLETLRRHGGVQTMGYEKLCLHRSPQTYRCEVANDYETEVKLNIRNDSSAKIKDINLECFGYTKTDTPVSGQRVTVYEFIEPNSTLSTSVKLKLVDNVAGFRCFKAK